MVLVLYYISSAKIFHLANYLLTLCFLEFICFIVFGGVEVSTIMVAVVVIVIVCCKKVSVYSIDFIFRFLFLFVLVCSGDSCSLAMSPDI